MHAIEFETVLDTPFIEIHDYAAVAHKHAKVIILVEDTVRTPNAKPTLAGALKKYATPRLIAEEKSIAWEIAMKEKHGTP